MMRNFEAWAKRDKPTLIWLGVLAFLLAIVAVPVEHPRRKSESQTATAQQRSEPKRAAEPYGVFPTAEPTLTPAPSEKVLSKTEIYERACNTPKDHQEAELCEQRRMADAAVSALNWGKYQTIVAGVGLLLIVSGLWASAMSAWAAAEQNRLSRKSLQMTHGAYLEIKDFTIKIAGTERRLDITYKIHNSGETNAIIEYVCAHYSVAKELPDRPTYNLSEGTKHAMEVMAGDALVMEDDPTRNRGLSKEVFLAIQKRTVKYFFYGVVAYKDVFGNAFKRGFVREVEVDNPETGKWRVRLVWPSVYGARISRFEYFREKNGDRRNGGGSA